MGLVGAKIRASDKNLPATKMGIHSEINPLFYLFFKEREESFNEHRKLEPVNENEEFCCLFRTRLGSHSVVYGAEMDGYRLRTPSEGPLTLDDFDLNQDGHFIELKTSRVIDSPRLEAR